MAGAAATPASRRSPASCSQHWADPTREDRVLFCQREAAETAIFLAEVAGRHGDADFRTRLEPENDAHNDGLPRVGAEDGDRLRQDRRDGDADRLADDQQGRQRRATPASPTGSSSSRPGITIRDRLRVLLPERRAELLRRARPGPAGPVGGAATGARSSITNYHAFLLKDAKEIQGVAANTRKLLHGRQARSTRSRRPPSRWSSRVLRDLGGRGKQRDRRAQRRGAPLLPGQAARRPATNADKEAKERNERRRVWFRGLQAIAKQVGIKQIYDLSATPFYLKGSGYNEGYIFPWMVSDFSLMDAIESGIVKVPRIPVDDDVATPSSWCTCACGTTSATSSRRRRPGRPPPTPTGCRRPSWKARCAASTAATAAVRALAGGAGAAG